MLSGVTPTVGDKQYFIDEQRHVPVGYKLVMDGISGMVYRKNVLTESTEIQSTMSHTLGGSLSGYANVGVFANGAVAASATSKAVDSMSARNSIAQAIGYSRSERMALVVDGLTPGIVDTFR